MIAAIQSKSEVANQQQADASVKQEQVFDSTCDIGINAMTVYSDSC
jgi:hypothetical protein